MLRKVILGDRPAAGAPRADVKDIPALATVLVTSEAPEHPVDLLFDTSGGPGGTRWIAEADGEQTLVLAFDAPQSIRAIGIEAEEPSATRTNVLTISLSEDGGRTWLHTSEIDTRPFVGGYGMRGGVALPDGTIVLPLCDVPDYRRVFVVRSDEDRKSVV